VEFLEVCWKSPGKFSDFCLFRSLKLGRQNTKHRLHTTLLPPPPSPPPLVYSIIGHRLSHQVVAAAFVESLPPPLSPSSRRHCCRRAVITELLPPTPLSSCRRPHLVTTAVVKPPSLSSCQLMQWCIIYLGGLSALTSLTPLLGLMLRRSSSGTIASKNKDIFYGLSDPRRQKVRFSPPQ